MFASFLQKIEDRVEDAVEAKFKEKRADTGWAITKFGPVAKDRSKEFEILCEEAKKRRDRSVLAGLGAENYMYLLVPGLLTEHYGEKYMKENKKRLEELGLTYKVVAIDTDQTVAVNAEVVRGAIVDSPKPVVLIGHSKGGVDIAAALSLYPHLAPKVRAFVAMQSPFGGTHIANIIGSSEVLLTLARKLVEDILKGNRHSILDLEYNARRTVLQKTPALDCKKIPTICFCSTAESGLMLLTIEVMEKFYKCKSDGLVPLMDAMIPGADLVQVHGIDHGASVMVFGKEKSENDVKIGKSGQPVMIVSPGDLTQALVIIALRKAKEMLG